MEILKKLIDLVIEFLNSQKTKKIENEEVKRVEIEQKQKTQKILEDRKNESIKPKPPTNDNFFND